MRRILDFSNLYFLIAFLKNYKYKNDRKLLDPESSEILNLLRSFHEFQDDNQSLFMFNVVTLGSI